MEIVLLVDVKGLGGRGAVVRVSDGYAMNLLIPQGKAVTIASAQAKQELSRTEALQGRATEKKKTAISNFQSLPSEITMKMPANEKDVLFTSVKPETLVKYLKEQKCQAEISWFAFEAIKALGTHTITATMGEESKSITITITK